jgi:hypothetical protein
LPPFVKANGGGQDIYADRKNLRRASMTEEDAAEGHACGSRRDSEPGATSLVHPSAGIREKAFQLRKACTSLDGGAIQEQRDARETRQMS